MVWNAVCIGLAVSLLMVPRAPGAVRVRRWALHPRTPRRIAGGVVRTMHGAAAALTTVSMAGILVVGFVGSTGAFA